MMMRVMIGADRESTLPLVSKKAKELITEQVGGNKSKFYRTSAATLALFGDTRSTNARQFLNRGAVLYTPVPGAVQPYRVAEAKRTKVMREKSPIQLPKSILSSPTTALDNRTALKSNETGHHKKDSERSQFDFSQIFEDQPQVNYYPVKFHSSAASKTNRTKEPHGHYRKNSSNNRSPGNDSPSFLSTTKDPVRNRLSAKQSVKSPEHQKEAQHTVDDVSVDDSMVSSLDSRSLVANEKAELPISLKAKAALMQLMIEKVSQEYKLRTQTDQTALRLQLLKSAGFGEDEGD